jgi:cytochrome o ubiquinol oxidase subunit 2
MKTAIRITFSLLIVLGILVLIGIYMGTISIPVLEPKGIIAEKERWLILFASCAMLVVVIPVFIFTAWFVWKYREGKRGSKYTPDWGDSLLAETLWWNIPFLIIVILGELTHTSSYELNPYKPIESAVPSMTIQVVALDWKWLFIYPEQGIATINYVQFPEQTPLNFQITADAPMNSFWIPQLGGQIYAMPAMRSQLHLMASEVGTFRGSSANISGKGFAGMTFNAVATSANDFETWVQSVKTTSKPLTFEEYTRLVEPSEYHPVTTFALADHTLFDQILMKYAPKQQE